MTEAVRRSEAIVTVSVSGSGVTAPALVGVTGAKAAVIRRGSTETAAVGQSDRDSSGKTE